MAVEYITFIMQGWYIPISAPAFMQRKKEKAAIVW